MTLRTILHGISVGVPLASALAFAAVAFNIRNSLGCICQPLDMLMMRSSHALHGTPGVALQWSIVAHESEELLIDVRDALHLERLHRAGLEHHEALVDKRLLLGQRLTALDESDIRVV